MPANPKDLYNELKKAGEISVTYEQFRKKWDTPGWNVDFHKALRKKQLTSLSYDDFVYAFGEDDPDYQTIELSQAELDAAGKEKVEPYPQLGPTKDTDSSGENTSWASPEKIQAIRERFGKETEAQDSSLLTQEEVDGLNTYIQELDKTPVEKAASPHKIANIQKVFGGKPQEEQAAALSLKQLNDVEKFVESLPDEGGVIPKNYSIVERGLDALLINMPTGLETAWESSKALLVNTVGNPQFYGVPKSVDLPEPLAEARDEYVVSQLSKVQELNKQVIDTGSLVGGYKEGDAQEFFGGVFNATQGVLSTVIPAMLTSGASLVPQVIAPTWTDYQITKAEAKYGDQEDPIAALIENNDVDNVVPLTIGAGMLVLEKAGFKGISKYLAGTKTGRKLMGIDTNKIAFLLTTNKEGITEWGQLGLEKINEALAEGKDLKTATASAYDTMFSADGLENYLQGMVGSGIITAPSAIDRTITRALHEDPDGHKIITGGIDAIAELKERRLQAGSKQVRDMYDKDIKDIENTIKSVLNENNKLVKHLTPQEDAKLRTILKKKDKIAKDISLLDEALAKGEIDTKERGYGVRRLNAENAKLSEDIAVLKQNIDKSKTQQDIQTAKKLSKHLPNTEVAAFKDTEGVKEYLRGIMRQDGTKFSEGAIETMSDSNGLFFTDAEGVDHIVINEDVALQEKRTTTGQHEFLHKVLAKTIAADPTVAETLGSKLESHVKNILGDDYKSSEYAQRVQGYVSSAQQEVGAVKEAVALKLAQASKLVADGTWNLEEYQKLETLLNAKLDTEIKEQVAIISEERLTLLSEALSSGDIKLNDQNRTFFQKIGEILRRFAQKLGLTDVRLETGEDIVRFIKDYNRGFEKGKLGKSIQKLIEEPKKETTTTSTDKDLLDSKKVKQSLNTAQRLSWQHQREEWDDHFVGKVIYETRTSEPFKVGEETYEVTLARRGGVTDLNSLSLDPVRGTEHLKNVVEVGFANITTGTPRTNLLKNSSHALKVLGTIVNGVEDIVKKAGVDGVVFIGDDEGARTRVYGAIANIFSKKLGWKLHQSVLEREEMDNIQFTVYKPKSTVKKSARAEKSDLYSKTDELYETLKDDKHTAGFLIAIEWENQIKSLARKYKNLPGYASNVEDLIAEAQHGGSQSIVGLVNSFKPGTKTTDGEGTVSLAGYINKWLPQYIQSKLHSVGIGVVEGQGGFAADVTEQKGLASEETAEDIITTEAQAQEQETRKYPKMKDALKIDKHPELKEYITKRVALNISGAIRLYGKAKTINTKSDAFVKAVKKGIQDDEKSLSVFKKFIKDYGYEKFLVDFKETILGNYTTTVLAKHPFYRQATQKRIKGVWKSPEAVVLNGKTTYEYLMDDGKIYPARHPDFDRDKAAQTGHTAGHFKIRRNPDAGNSISTNAFVDYHFSDGVTRRVIKANPLESMGMQFASELGFELLEEQLLNREGDIYDAFESRVQLTEEMTPEQKDHAIKQGLIIREGMAAVLTDRGIAETLKDLDRGGVKQSKVNKTGFNWFDRPRIDMTNYLARLENNEVREGVVNGTIGSPDYDLLYTDMKDAYDMYLGMLDYQTEWADNLQAYANAFKDKDFSDFDDFVDDTLNQVSQSIDGILGLEPGATSFGVKNKARKDLAKKEGVEAYINDRLNEDVNKGLELSLLVRTLVGATSGSVSGALYHNTPGFYNEVVVPMVNAHGIPSGDFKLEEVEGGTTITYKGEKITTDFARGVYSEDIFTTFDNLANSPKVLDNNIDMKGRLADAKESGQLYRDYVKWLRQNYKRLSPSTIGMMLKGFASRGRSVAQVMHPITGSMLTQDNSGVEDYVTVPTIPANYVARTALDYVLGNSSISALDKVIREGTSAILPKVYAKVVDQFHHSTPNNNFDTPQINKKLRELDLPKITLTDLENEPTIPVLNLEALKDVVKFDKTSNAIKESMRYSKPQKGISVWDFDDTLAKTQSKVRYTDFDGKVKRISPAEFAEQGDTLLEAGIEFDFSEFTKVVKGKKGPLFDTAVKRNEKFGNEHVYILTARPQASAHAIHEFLKGIGLEVRLENITGLANSSPEAKASWIVGKVEEGYNDFYFADDHIGNVQAVKDVLKSADVKSDVVQAKVKRSATLSDTFNEMLERTTGIKDLARRKVKAAEGHLTGREYDRKAKARLRLFVPPSAEDYIGLLYKFMGKGTQGDLDKNWIMTHLVDPYLEGVNKLDVMNTAINREYNALMKAHPAVRNKLHDKVPDMNYTYDMAIRYYLYERSGYGDLLKDSVSARDGMALMKTVMLDKQLRAFADELSAASKQAEGYVKPDAENWLIQSIATDFKSLITDAHRAKMLQEFTDNTDMVFSKENLNKIESIYGTKFRRALEESIARMKSGTKRLHSGDPATRRFINWATGAIAPIMFLNQRSAMLQLLSIPNFINWSDNNPAMIAKAMTNPKQLGKDIVTILNSPKMVQRRNGLRFSIEEAELANIGGSEGAYGVFMKRLIKLGFMPTQVADGLAIAIGGAPMYRNRINTYKKMVDKDGNKLYTEKEAEDLAWKDFSKISDEAQQSSDQMLTSSEQAGGLGRIILAFANTPAQYTRLMKKAALDIKNGRGDLKTNISKIVYYGAVQNFFFTALQTALFATWGFFTGEEDEELTEEELIALTKSRDEKENRVVNGMMDTVLRGMGARGAVLATIKNTAISYLQQEEKPLPNYAQPVITALSVSPPIGSKARDFNRMMTNERYNRDIIDNKGWAWDSPRWMTLGLGLKVALNLPGDYIPKKIEIGKAIASDQGTLGQDAMLGMGWTPYDLGLTDEEFVEIKNEAKATRKEEAAERRKEKNVLKKLEKQAALDKRTPAEVKRDSIAAKQKAKERAQKAAATRKKNKEAKDREIWEKAQEAARNRRKQD